MKQLRFLVMFVAVGTMLSGCVWSKQTLSTGPTQSAVSAGAGGGMQGGQVVAPPPRWNPHRVRQELRD